MRSLSAILARCKLDGDCLIWTGAIADEIRRKLKEYDEAIAEEADAASRASLLADELLDLGFDVEGRW